MFVAIHEPVHRRVVFPFEIVNGERISDVGEIPLGEGLTSRVIDSRQPLRLATHDEMLGYGVFEDSVPAESWLGVPILAGDRVLGVIALETRQRYSYSEADERFLEHPGGQHGRRPRERPAVRRDETPALRHRTTVPPSSR